MSKAKEKALRVYPIKIAERDGYDENLRERKGFVKGYHQAEKDLELTWEDIPKIFQISEELKTSWWFRDNEQTKLIGTQVFWEEVLKRFNEERKK
jgi:hypothetical protein